jgi:hypothetical protein
MERFIVRDANGNWQGSYNVALGKESARAWAIQSAVRIKGCVYTSGADGKETKIFPIANTQEKSA